MRYKRKIILSGVAVTLLVAATSLTLGLTHQTVQADAINSTDFVATWRISDPTSTIVTINTAYIADNPYNYNVDWNNDGVPDQTGLTSFVSHDFGAVGDYTVRISGVFPSFYSTYQPANAPALIDIKQWGTNQWKSMNNAFSNTKLTTLSATDTPDLSKVTDMSYAFYYAKDFNGDISGWNMSHVTNMAYMFSGAEAFNQDISGWNTSLVTNMSGMFNYSSAFNQNLSSWNTSKVTNLAYMFYSAGQFNGDISGWNTSNVTNMASMFSGARKFNSDISGWNTSHVLDMSYMFSGAYAFNKPLSNWNTSLVTNMSGMFNGTSAFNQDISEWNTSRVTNMSDLFYNASQFNQDISRWNTSLVTNMSGMFNSAYAFNQALSNWDTSQVTNMSGMFNSAMAFNQDISGWNTGKVSNMYMMFYNAAAFNQNISALNVSKVTDMTNILSFSNLSISNYDATLIGWASQAGLRSGVIFGAYGRTYCAGTQARQTLITSFGWVISQDSQCSLPSSPTTLIATPSVYDVGLSWTKPSDPQNTLTDYTIEYSSDGGTTWSVFAHDPSNATTATVTNLMPNAGYHFRVAAINGRGASAPSNSAITQTLTSTPEAPTGLVSAPSSQAVELTWNAPARNGGSAITNYILEYSIDNGSTWQEFIHDASTETTITVDSLFQSTAYLFRVTAVNAIGHSAHSQTTQATPTITPTTAIISGEGPLEDSLILPKRPTFSGTTIPLSTVTVTVHSDPLTCSTTSDSAGKWACSLSKDLEPGNHQVLVHILLPDATTQQLGPYLAVVTADVPIKQDAGDKSESPAASTPKATTQTSVRTPIPEEDTSNIKQVDSQPGDIKTEIIPSDQKDTDSEVDQESLQAKKGNSFWTIIAAISSVSVLGIALLIRKQVRT